MQINLNDDCVMQIIMTRPTLVKKLAMVSSKWKDIVERHVVCKFILTHSLSENTCRIAAREKNLQAFKYFYEHKFPIDYVATFYECVELDCYECFTFLCEITIVDKMNTKWANQLACIGNVKYLQYAYSHGFVIDDNAYELAIKYDHDKCAEFIYEMLNKK